jgi:molybdopterin/thiamine biosynthesis adenylyltransferase
MTNLERRRILIVGAGRLGSMLTKYLAELAENLVIAIVDKDRVEHHNLLRTELFDLLDIGQPKVFAIKQKIEQKNPKIMIEAHPNFAQELNLAFYYQFSLLIACPDNQRARNWVQLQAIAMQRPALFAGLDDRGGYIFIYRPGSACFYCLRNHDSGLRSTREKQLPKEITDFIQNLAKIVIRELLRLNRYNLYSFSFADLALRRQRIPRSEQCVCSCRLILLERR